MIHNHAFGQSADGLFFFCMRDLEAAACGCRCCCCACRHGRAPPQQSQRANHNPVQESNGRFQSFFAPSPLITVRSVRGHTQRGHCQQTSKTRSARMECAFWNTPSWHVYSKMPLLHASVASGNLLHKAWTIDPPYERVQPFFLFAFCI